MIEELEEFFRKFYEEDLLEAVREDKDFVLIDFKKLDKYTGHELTDELLENPKDFFEAAENAIDEIDLGTDKEVSLNVRVENIPDDEKTRIKDLRSKHLGKFVKVEGTVKRASEVKPELEVAIFECPDCGETMEVPQLKKRMSYPSRCDCGRKRGFNQVDRELSDARWIHMEDLFEKVSGEKPGEVSVYLKDGLTTPRMQRRTDPGTRLEITGRVREMPKRVQGKKTKKLDIFLEANWINPKEVTFEEMEVTEEEEEEIRELANDDNIYEKLVKSLAPSMYGMEDEKEAIILQLFGGVPHRLPDSTKIRGDIHILFVGDPSAGKTQLLKLAAEMLPRGKYASGKGTTAAGLCVTGDTLVTLEDGEMRKIKDLVEVEFDKNGKKEHEEGIFKSSDPSSLNILAFDKDEMKVRPMEVSQFWKIKAPEKLYKVKTRSGREVTVTPDNPLPVFDSGEISWKKAKDVEAEELLAVPRKIDTKSEEENNFLPELVDETARLQNSAETVKSFAEDLRNNGGIRSFSQKTGISEDGLYYDWKNDDRRGAPRLEDLRRTAEYTGDDLRQSLPSTLELSQKNGHEIKLPKEIDEEMMYLQGLLAGDGDIYSTSYGGMGLRLTNSEPEVLQQADSTLSKFDIKTNIYREEEKVPQLRFASKIFGSLAQSLGIPVGEKKDKIEVSRELSKMRDELISSFISGFFDADGSAIERDNGASYIDLTQSSKEYLRQIRLLLLRFGIRSKIRKRNPTVSEIRGQEIRSTAKYALEIKGKENLEKFNEEIGFNVSSKDEKLQRIIDSIDEYHTNVDLVPGIGSLLKEAREDLGLSAKELYGYKNYSYEEGRRDISRRKLEKIVEKLKSHGTSEAVEKISRIANSDLYFDAIKEIEVIEDGDEWVYDLTVENDHSFMANSTIVHNTATVVRDEELMGGWVLEAGALVLANQGVLCIDEFDKMSKEDQVNLHEAMSTQTVSISKATIQATLPAETSIIGGANPKFSRFDPYRPIAEQIDIPDTLLSRFDLKFALRDVPDREKDERIVDHIIDSRVGDESEAEPLIDIDFLKKYISYARRNCRPQMTKKAAATLKNFYVDMRNKYVDAESDTVPITLRQYEALQRLAEASAKVRLDEEVRKQDAQRAIKLMKHSIKQLGMDPETNEIDIDRAEGGTPASERSKMSKVMDVLDDLEEDLGNNIPEEDLLSALEEEGLSKPDKLIKEMKNKGMIFEPRPGHVQRV
ncbi:MAG: LAGLIDADG family homing endonuclease [Candidatus Aenigmatarchaeota archaeon]